MAKTVVVKTSGTSLADLATLLEGLAGKQVMVGYPEDAANARRRENQSLTNAQLAYIHDNGAPEANIPQRSFMRPGVESKSSQIASALFSAAKATLAGDSARADQMLARAGVHAVNGIRNTLTEGVPPPLSDATLRARANRKAGRGKGAREGAAWELAWRQAGAEPGTDIAKPLIDTGQLRNGVTFVIRTGRK